MATRPSSPHLRVERTGERVRVRFADVVVADSTTGLCLHEGQLPPVYYLPREDVDMARFQRTAHTTYCPFKGNATYWSLAVEGRVAENVMWSYEQPYGEAADLTGLVAFYGNLVDQSVGTGTAGEQHAGAGRDPEARPAAAVPVEGPYANPLLSWLLGAAPLHADAAALTLALAERLVAAGIPVSRLNVVIRTLHPQHVGYSYRWDDPPGSVETFELSHALMQSPRWLASPLHHIYAGAGGIRRRLDIETPRLDHPILEELQADGATDYVAMPLVFSDGRPHALTLSTRSPGGFETRHLGFLYEILGVLARLYEVHQGRSVALNLLDAYLGRYTGKRVLEGQVQRGDARDISAVIWFCDLRGSTELAAALGRHAFLTLLNQVFDRLAAPVLTHGGEILRFIGDAALAIFPIGAADDGADEYAHVTDASPAEREALACAALERALAAVDDAVAGMAALNAERTLAGEQVVGFGIGLHEGVVTFGNIGTDARLEFTVIGEAANFAARIESLCKETDRPVLLSEAVARRFPGRFVHVGEFELRGVAGRHSVHTLDPSR